MPTESVLSLEALSKKTSTNGVPLNFHPPQTIGSLRAGTIMMIWHIDGTVMLERRCPKPPYRQATSRSQFLST